MKQEILNLLKVAAAFLIDTEREIQERCAETTLQKLRALKTDIETAIKDAGRTENKTAVDAATMEAALDRLEATIGDRMALEVRAAIDEKDAEKAEAEAAQAKA